MSFIIPVLLQHYRNVIMDICKNVNTWKLKIGKKTLDLEYLNIRVLWLRKWAVRHCMFKKVIVLSFAHHPSQSIVNSIKNNYNNCKIVVFKLKKIN